MSHMKLSIKSNIHIKSFKSKANTIIRKEIGPSFSYANLISNYSRSKFDDKEAQQISQIFSMLKSTKSIKLDLKNSKELTDKGLFWISEGLRKLSSVNAIFINLTGCDRITNKGIENLTKGAKRMRFLRKFHLNLQGCSQVDDDGLRHLRRDLQELASLGDISMNLCGCYFISDEGIGIVTSFGRPFSMRSIHIEWSFLGNLTNSSTRKTTRGLKRFNFLENLSLRYHKCVGCETVDGNEGIKAFVQSFEKMNHLNRTNLDFEGCIRVGNPGVDYLCEALSQLSSLQTIQLSFASVYLVTDEGLKAIQKFARNPQLKEISLNFSSIDGITDQGLINITDFLNNKPELQKISLNFSSCYQITDKGLTALAEALKKQKSLKSLSLAFESCWMITDVGFGRINEALKQISSLKNIDFNFSRSEHLSNKFCESFTETLKNNLTQTLKTVKLNLLQCTSICDKGLTSLSEGFKTCHSLQSVHLVFQGCSKITHTSFISLSESLKKSSHLESIDLDFSWCEEIKNEGLKSLNKCLERLPLLYKINLNLEGCSQITDSGLLSLKETLETKSLLTEANLLFMNSGITFEGYKGTIKSLKKMDSLQKFNFSCSFNDDEF